ncbi:MAG: type I methionyl aminopeptidase [Kiritimatiellae bacterium]|nr:type I methionyl aminopeptidase [Kiritimatiellia bacterium]MDD5522249.1 type I methionyl aminopeptidase [Kiritimatiellia bacterium]
MIVIKSAAEIERMRTSGHLAAVVRDDVAAKVSPGITTMELSEYAGELMKKLGAESAFKGYRGYPGNICISVNDAVVHGIPDQRHIQLGDIVSIDVGVKYEGFIGDTALTVMVGVTDPEVLRLVKTTEKSLEAGIAAALSGKRVSDISNAVEKTVTGAGFSVVRDFVGHGVGRQMHEDPQIPNFGPPGRGAVLKPGMTFAIEPMVNQGGAEVEVQADGWTVLTRDRKLSAHFEHTVAITEGLAQILTI